MSTDNHNNDGFPFIPVARDSGSHDSHLLDIQDNNNSQTPSSPIGGGGKGGKPRSQRSSSNPRVHQTQAEVMNEHSSNDQSGHAMTTGHQMVDAIQSWWIMAI
ncbi:15098_t:CDS:2 [Entrophospora sp. SA101]|nr:15098_t:CDS:2 [Entrophospora sp. SA101]